MYPRVSLALRRARGQAVAVEVLAQRVGLRPERVAEAVAALVAGGFAIESHPLQGVRLLDPPPGLLADELASDLDAARVGHAVRCLDEASSTNDLAWQAADQGRETADGLAIFAEYQTAGRGRRGNRWLAPPHSSLLCSVVLWVPHGPALAGVLTRAVSLAAAEAIEAETDLQVGIRWPNDLVIEDRKVGGVLVEARAGRGEEAVAVLGIGINVTQRAEAFPADIRPGVLSLAMAGASPDRTLLGRRLLERLDAVCGQMGQQTGAEAVCQAVARRSRTLGRHITVSDGPDQVTGEVVALDPDYGLLLRLETGAIRRFPPMTTHVVSQGGG